jgi:DNA-binding SARP family transcriptional activator
MLGPVSVAPEGGAPVLTGKVAVLVARLAVAGGVAIGRERLLDDVWPTGSGHPGPLRVAVQRARGVLGPGSIVTVGSSYRIGPHTSDVRRAEQHLAMARDITRDAPARVAAYDRALAEWTGSFLDGVDGGVWLQAERVRLDEVREAAIDERFELLLAAGGHHLALSALGAAAVAAPTREHRAWLLALALYRCGRQADALSTINMWGRRLRNDFGLEPGLALRDLERRILHHDPSLDLPAAAEPLVGPAGAPVVDPGVDPSLTAHHRLRHRGHQQPACRERRGL